MQYTTEYSCAVLYLCYSIFSKHKLAVFIVLPLSLLIIYEIIHSIKSLKSAIIFFNTIHTVCSSPCTEYISIQYKHFLQMWSCTSKLFCHSLKIVYRDAGAQTEIFLEKDHTALLRPVFYICTVEISLKKSCSKFVV